MPDGPSRAQYVLVAAAVIAVALLGARYLAGGGSPAASRAPAPPVRVEEPSRSAAALVHVAGAVRRPGVYRMAPGERVDDAVRRAGGATSKADLGAVNLAAKVEDGRQVLVPERVEAPSGGAAAAPGPASSAAPSAGAAGATPPGGLIDLNTATLEQLDTHAGVGPATAQKIIDFRTEHGGFGSVDELAQVPGIGEKRLASLREQVRV